jgi:hypothetical protein
MMRMFELCSLEWYVLLFIVFIFSILLVMFEDEDDELECENW